MTTTQKYVDIMNGTQYDLPGSEPTNGFREGVYDPDQATDTGTTSRIRALLYVWQAEALNITPSITTGPFFNNSEDTTKNLSVAQKNRMRSEETSEGVFSAGDVIVLSDSGYAPNYDAQCSDSPDQVDPWETLESVFTYDAGGGTTEQYLKRYFVPTAANDSQTNKLDIWQIQSSDYGTYKSSVIICSDIFHIIGPTRYGQDSQSGDLSLTTLGNRFPDTTTGNTDYDAYSQVKTAFKNLYGILNDGGYLIFSVPYDGDPDGTTGTPVELAPFPAGESNNTQKCYLWDWNFGETNNEDVIENTPRGETESEDVDNLVFTRSINCPPVLRTFTRGAIKEMLEKADSSTTGFENVEFHTITTSMNAFGIYWDAEVTTPGGNATWEADNSSTDGKLASKSLIITAQRPFTNNQT